MYWFLLAVLETVDTLDTQAEEIEHGVEDNNTTTESAGDAEPSTATDTDNQQQPRLVYPLQARLVVFYKKKILSLASRPNTSGF